MSIKKVRPKDLKLVKDWLVCDNKGAFDTLIKNNEMFINSIALQHVQENTSFESSDRIKYQACLSFAKACITHGELRFETKDLMFSDYATNIINNDIIILLNKDGFKDQGNISAADKLESEYLEPEDQVFEEGDASLSQSEMYKFLKSKLGPAQTNMFRMFHETADIDRTIFAYSEYWRVSQLEVSCVRLDVLANVRHQLAMSPIFSQLTWVDQSWKGCQTHSQDKTIKRYEKQGDITRFFTSPSTVKYEVKKIKTRTIYLETAEVFGHQIMSLSNEVCSQGGKSFSEVASLVEVNLGAHIYKELGCEDEFDDLEREVFDGSTYVSQKNFWDYLVRQQKYFDLDVVHKYIPYEKSSMCAKKAIAKINSYKDK